MSESLPAPVRAQLPTKLASTHVKVLPKGTLLGRIHSQGGAHPTSWEEFRFFGPTGARFDHQPPPPRHHPSRGVYYAAPRTKAASILETCVLECYQGRRVVELSRNDPYFVLFRTTEPLRLLDLTSNWVARAGGNAAISSGRRSVARDWSRRIYATYGDIDGLRFQCSLNPAAISLALYERSEPAMPLRPEGHWPLSHLALRADLERIAANFHLGLLP